MRRTHLTWAAIALAGLLFPRASHADPCSIEKKAVIPLGSALGAQSTVPATINGTAVTMELDTGASTLVTPSIASRLKLPRDWRRTRAIGTTAVTIVNNVIIRAFEFGGERENYKTVPNISISAKMALNAGSVVPTEVAGLLGSDTLARFDVDLDFVKRQMTLYRVKGCKTVKPEWTGPYASVPITPGLYRPITIPVEVNGRKANAIFDTGAMQSAITKMSAIRLGVKVEDLSKATKQVYYGVGDVAAKLANYPFKTVKVGEETINDMRLTVLEISLLNADMLLGMDYMAGGRFFISNATRTLYLQPGSHTLLNAQAAFYAAASQWPATHPLAPSAAAPAPKCGASELYALNRCMRIPDNNLGVASAAAANPSLIPSSTPGAPAVGSPPPELFDPSACAGGLIKRNGNCSPGGANVQVRPSGQYAQLRDIDPISLKALNLGQDYAVLVVLPYAVSEDGLRTGDVLLAVDGARLQRDTLTIDGLKDRDTGTRTPMTVWRQGERREVFAPVCRAAEAAGKKGNVEFAVKPERMVEAETTIASIFPSDVYPEIWWRTQASIAAQYLDGIFENRADAVEAAIRALYRAQMRLTMAARPADWAAVEMNLARAYWERTEEDRSVNMENSTYAIRQALKVYAAPSSSGSQSYKLLLGQALSWLARNMMERHAGSRSDNIEEAIKSYNGALAIFTSVVSPRQWAVLQEGLGDAYRLRVAGAVADNLEAAIKAYEASLTFFSAKITPLEWARTQKNLGLAYQARIGGGAKENKDRAARAFESALTVFSPGQKEYAEIKQLLQGVGARS